MSVHLPTLSTNGLEKYRTCPRMYRMTYIDGREPIVDSDALDFGSLWHDGQEGYWRAIMAGTDALDGGLAAIERSTHARDEFAREQARLLFVGYHARWFDHDAAASVTHVEHAFTVPIPGTTCTLNGRIDLGQSHAVGEHKATTADISLGSTYWTKLRLNAQVSNYAVAAPSLGLDPSHCLYDVVRRPDIQPAKATPLESRKYTQPKDKACPLCKKKGSPPAPHDVDLPSDIDGDPPRVVQCAEGRVVTDPGGRLYANMRDADETLAEYSARLAADIVARPEDYFRRATIVRTARELEDAVDDLRDAVRQIEHSMAYEAWPRNPWACWSYGRICSFFDVCSGTASLDDPTKFRRRSTS